MTTAHEKEEPLWISGPAVLCQRGYHMFQARGLRGVQVINMRSCPAAQERGGLRFGRL